ncbi:MAG: hypothetical protein RL726_1438, partial [Actinomycetota bacterium]
DIESRIDVLRRYMNVESIESRLRSPSPNVGDGIVNVEGRTVVASLPTLVVPPTVSRGIRLAQLDRGIAVTVALGWWFSMWGIWFTVTRGDGLVLADLPVRRGGTEIVPNAFDVRPGDMTARLRRGPRTTRRVLVAVATVLALIGALVVGAKERSVQSISIEGSPTSVGDSPSTTPPPSNPGPSNSRPNYTLPPQRVAGSDYVSIDGVARLDVDVSTIVAPVGGTLQVALSFDLSGINTFGAVSPDGDQTEAYRSCLANLDLYRDVPVQAGATERFRVLLEDSSGGRLLVHDESVQLTLVGAMVEGCPEPATSGNDPYRILQRTFYETITIPVIIPVETASGEYSIDIEVGTHRWSTTGETSLRVE